MLEEAGKYAAAAHLQAEQRLGAATRTVRKSWRVSFPSLHQGQCGDVVNGFKKAMAEDGLRRQRRLLLRRQDRAARFSPTAK